LGVLLSIIVVIIDLVIIALRASHPLATASVSSSLFSEKGIHAGFIIADRWTESRISVG
jgi:hypothetical protein